MPCVNITLTRGALAPLVLRSVVRHIVQIFNELQGAPRTQHLRLAITSARVIEIEPDHFFLGGEIAKLPRYEIEFVTFHSVLDAAAKRALVARATDVVRAADKRRSDDQRIWCFFREIADGDWGSDGKIYSSREVVRWMAHRAHDARVCATTDDIDPS